MVARQLAAAAAGGTLSLPGLFAGNPTAAAIPQRAAVAYIQAAASAPCRVDWRDLAAIGFTESKHGTLFGSSIGPDGKLTKPIVSSAGADGPMQFMPGTGAKYVVDADGDGTADVNDIDDAAPATAAKLCADGYERDRLEVIGAYNGGGNWRVYGESLAYVKTVDAYAAELPEIDPQKVGSLTGGTGKDRSLGAFLDRVWDRVVVRGWVGMGTRLVGSPQQVWEQVDNAAFGTPQVGTAAAATGIQPLMSKATWAQAWAGPALQPDFQRRLDAMFAAAPGAITVSSGWRSVATQKELFDASDRSGKWVAFSDGVTCGSNHCKGLAADLAFASAATLDWAHQHAGEFGLAFPLSWEDWHCEPVGVR